MATITVKGQEIVLDKTKMLVDGAFVFRRAQIRKALLEKVGTLRCQCVGCLPIGDCAATLAFQRKPSGTFRVGCTTVPAKTVAIIRKWANAK